jgi:hypothetical protein
VELVVEDWVVAGEEEVVVAEVVGGEVEGKEA